MSKFPPTSQQLTRAARRGDLGLSGALVGAAGLWFWGAWVWWRAPSWGQTLALLWRDGLGGQALQEALVLSALALELCAGLGSVWVVEWLADAAQAPAHLTSPGNPPLRGQWPRALLGAGASALMVALWVTRDWTSGDLPWEACQEAVGFGLGLGLCVAALDAWLVRWLRWRSLHMTREAFMRDHKEAELNPDLKRALRAQTPDNDEPNPPVDPALAEAVNDLAHVVIAICDLNRHLCVCLSYDPPLIDPPHLGLTTQTQPETKALLQMLNARQIPIIHDPSLLREVRSLTRPAGPLPEALYDKVIFFLRLFPNKLPKNAK